jgi:putative toxin-antitoxin system antitoxin component (TIGR02293 family)
MGIDVAEVLGLEEGASIPNGSLALMTRVDEGLPLSALDRLAKAVAPGDSQFPYRLVPRATLARRRAMPAGQQVLSAEEGAKVARLASVWALALEVWKDPEAARRFLRKPHMLLQGRTSLDVVLANELGGRLVENILGGGLYSVAL